MPIFFAPIAPIAGQHVQPKTPLTFKIGYAYLSDKNARDATNSSGYSVGLSYGLGNVGVATDGAFSVDLDFTKHAGNGNKLENWSLLGVYRASFDKGNASGFYYGVGLGLTNTLVSQGFGTQTAFLTRQVQGSGGGGNGGGAGSFSDRQTVFAGIVLIGTRLGENGSVELYYRFQKSVSGVNPNTIGITYGVHF